MSWICRICKGVGNCRPGCTNQVGNVIESRSALNNRVNEAVLKTIPADRGNWNTIGGRVAIKRYVRGVILEMFKPFLKKTVRFIFLFGVRLSNMGGTEFEHDLLLEDVDLININTIPELYKVIDKIIVRMETFVYEHEYEQSGLVIKGISYIMLKTFELSMVGRSYIDLPKEIKNKKACINIKNTDEKCFLWCIIAHFKNKEKKLSNPSKVSHYKKNELIKKWDLSSIKFPVKVGEMNLFEIDNKITINVYYYDGKSINLLYPRGERVIDEERHVNLLLYKDHYCLIKSLSRLFSAYSEGNNKSYVCNGCGIAIFSTAKALEKHHQDCGRCDYKLPDTFKLEFKNYQNSVEVPFIIYADFESYFEDLSDNKEMNTGKIVFNKIHKPLAFCFMTVCRSDKKLNNKEIYIGKNADKKFAEELYNEAIRIEEILSEPLDMIEVDYNEYNKAKECYICKKKFIEEDMNYKKVRDHDHINGKYRGAAHNVCNLQYTKLNYTIPVVFHNLEGYDLHLFIESLAKYTNKYSIIPKSKEKYLSMSINLIDSRIRLKFIDSLHFVTGSLAENAKRLSSFKFTLDDTLKSKQVFPYSYLTASKVKDIDAILMESSLPFESKDWINDLTKEATSQNDIDYAHKIFGMYGCRNIKDYTLLYLDTDVILLAEVFENFRDVSMKTYNLDPSWYYTTPGFAWVV